MDLRAAVAAVFLLHGVTGYTQSFDTGADLLKVCKNSLEGTNKARHGLDRGFCTGYVDGYIAGYSIRTAFPKARSVCENVNRMTREQLVREVVAALEKKDAAILSEPKGIAMFHVFLDSSISCP